MAQTESLCELELELEEIICEQDFSRRVRSGGHELPAGIAKKINAILTEVEEREQGMQARLQILTDARDDAQTASLLLKHLKNELKSQTQHLDKALSKAAEASTAKSQFLANMSHEIRTPMNGILGTAELLARSSLNPKQHKHVGTIIRSGRALLAIINDILDFSKVESGKFDLESVPFNFKRCIDDVAALLTPTAEGKGIALRVNFDKNLPHYYLGDVGRIRQVLTNVLGNAVKFTDVGHVEVRLTGDVVDGRGVLQIEVSDTGIGIPKDKIEGVFDKFHQVDNTSTRRHEGTGLGLTICKLLVERMEGKIDLKSTEGVGSIFWFELSLPVHDRPVEVLENKVDVGKLRMLLLQPWQSAEPKLQEHLVQIGCDVSIETDWVRVFDNASGFTSENCDLIWLNVQQVDDTLLRRLKEIQNHSELSHVPVIVLTSEGFRGDAKRLSDAGVRAYLTLPLPLEGFQHAIEVVLNDVSPESPMLVTKHTLDEDGGPSVSAEPQDIEQDTQSGPSVGQALVVEDSLVNQEVAREFLEALDWNVKIAENGQEAVTEVENSEFDLILMDCQMPVMDGFAATRVIREMEIKKNRRKTPIIALTANAFQSDRDKCISSGMTDFLSKPFLPEEFESMVQKWTN